MFPDVVVVSDLNKNIGGSTDLEKKKKDTDRRISIPLFNPLFINRVRQYSYNVSDDMRSRND